jgi:hypothetical protein
MTTGIEELKLPVVKKGRGLGKKPALICTSLRLSREVMDYYKQFENQQVKMRQVLTDHYLNEQALTKLGFNHVTISEGEEYVG